ncbi:hypothetical protein BC939DRAFT_238704 [Gamsiella multidivaricata]|uniref:uncharacterized protein n=1 Tax=Gamsiella multidivaricata TaxID=101098 RepID=UPI00221F4CD7|nr:uncharacterized protein BC939DRAFT_238704 [Gamsiella multidivaricata]KAI7820335.1 hypothetical protein BC939DRAFT_238704 [Gamsiella multidivaricata]
MSFLRYSPTSLTDHDSGATQPNHDESRNQNQDLDSQPSGLKSNSTVFVPPGETSPAPVPITNNSTKFRKKKKKNGSARVAGPGARTLCRLCCCSQRFNHLASADQLWQPLTLARFPDRHWPTTDQKSLT